jgi:DNA replication and repair protein RecF
MYLKKMVFENFRNLKNNLIEFPEEGAIFQGGNGSGKTSILEAIHILCSGRSQRGSLKNEIINYNTNNATIGGEFLYNENADIRKKKEISFNRDDNTEMKINDQKTSSCIEWFVSHPIVSFASKDIQLVYGTPEDRRKLIDVFISISDKDYLSALINYRKNLVLRNQILKNNGDAILCGIYEENMAESGALIVQKRDDFISNLAHGGIQIYKDISGIKECFFMKYKPDFTLESSSKNTWKNVFYSMLSERRKIDREIGFSTFGPHRDDILFFLNNKPAKTYASQGQIRSIVLSCKLSYIHFIENKHNIKCIIIFDDAISELDRDRTVRVYSMIENKGQLFIASPERTTAFKKRLKQFSVINGAVTEV